ncbi:eCIS core domain-containing protein [Flavobacterium sp. GCM10027622]|uniref:eCIS core domain-containing protein n=1 Tax=unclassified Flavobacterium TaxID=196869 RepID=UPI00361D8558
MENVSMFRERNDGAKNTSFFKPVIQKKLSVGSSNDSYEVEAGHMADRVMSMPKPSLTDFSHSGALIQRKCSACEQEEKIQKKPLAETIQKVGNSDSQTSTAPSQVETGINSSKGGGNSMDHSTKDFMESRFGIDFSQVRIHTGGEAIQMSRDLNAQAFTVGNDIYFNQGKYNPATESGKHLLAHELTHTVQQSKTLHRKIQRSCHDGQCDTCAGGVKDLWISVFFRRAATSRAISELRRQINEAKTILRNCCINLKFDFNWNRVSGAASMDAYTPATATDRWRFTAEETALGTGTTFSGARGIPMLVVDDVPLSGGGVTVDTRFDPGYTGSSYFIIGLFQSTTPNNTTNHIAHELSHIAGINHGQAGNSSLDNSSGNEVSSRYCTGLRALT